MVVVPKRKDENFELGFRWMIVFVTVWKLGRTSFLERGIMGA